MRLAHTTFVAVCCCGAAGAAPAPSFEERVALLFRPPVGEMMALSPDGQRVAYTTQAGRDAAIVVMNLEPPGVKRTVVADPNREAEFAKNQPPVRVRFLRWATPTRLVYAPTERILPLPAVPGGDGALGPNPDGPTIVSPILSMDADGKANGTLVDAKDFTETPAEARRTLADLLRTHQELAVARNAPVRWRMPHLDVLGFLPTDREQLILGTHGAYSMPAQHLVDIRTGSVREFGADWTAPPGDQQVYDWFRLKVVGERKPAARPTTAWRDEDLARVQRELEQRFPRRTVEVLDWSDTRARVLCRVTGGSDAGRIFVYQRPEDLVLEILQSAPWLGAAALHETRFFEFQSGDGIPLSGYVTWPRQPRAARPPLLVVFPSGFPGHAQRSFDPEAQVFADLGFVVMRLNHRCVGGVRPRDVTPLRVAIDRVSVQDARAAIEWLARHNPERPFDATRVATLGRGFGGYLATRALQLEPAVFRCAMAIDAPMDLDAWARTAATEATYAAAQSGLPTELVEQSEWKKLSVLAQAETLQQPVMLLTHPGRSDMVEAASALHARLAELGRPCHRVELDAGFANAVPEARASVYRQMGEFLAVNLPGYAAKMSTTKEVQ